MPKNACFWKIRFARKLAANEKKLRISHSAPKIKWKQLKEIIFPICQTKTKR